MAVKMENKTFEEERALYGQEHVQPENCEFGPAGANPLMECGIVEAKGCRFYSQYPLWHNRTVALDTCEFSPDSHAALWYSKNINIINTKLHGAKALRECENAVMRDCDINSSEFGWCTKGIRLTDSSAKGEYFFMHAKNLAVRRLDFKGKYAFQYAEDAIIMDSTLNTRAALWHSKDVTVENCVLIGEYLGWYSKNLTLKNCTVIGTQPFCYCKNLKLVDCVMQNTDRAFERSEVYAVLRSKIDSILNPAKGVIKAPEVGTIIRDNACAKCKILIDPQLLRGYRND